MKTENILIIAAGLAAGYYVGKKKEDVAVGSVIISKDKAREIASNWHGGQWSALYQFASSGIYSANDHDNYIQEVLNNIENEYHAPYPSKLKKKDEADLKKLLKWFEYKGSEHGIETVLSKHPDYGFTVVKSITPSNIPIRPVAYLKGISGMTCNAQYAL